MEEKLARRLNGYYYGFFVLAVLVATLGWYLMMKKQMAGFAPLSMAGQVISYIVIFYTILSVAGGLYGFKKACDKVRTLPTDEQKYHAYYGWAVARLCIIGIGVSLGIAAFYLLHAYQSMIWCAAISAIGLFFCKPNPKKVYLEIFGEPTIPEPTAKPTDEAKEETEPKEQEPAQEANTNEADKTDKTDSKNE